MASSLPDVAIIIAAYNVQNYIERAIHSALDQKNVIVEAIVVDDASTDATAQIAGQIQDSRIKIIRRQQNGGASFARNLGIAASSAPWLAVLDGDDALEPDRCERCLKLAHSTNADIVVDNLNVFCETDKTQHLMFEADDFGGSDFLELYTFIKGNSAFLGGKSLGYLKPIFSKSFLQNNNLSYDPAIRIGEDYVLMAEALACGAKCAIEPHAGYIYTQRAGSTSHRLRLDDIQRIIAGDEVLLGKYNLSSTALDAQRQRTADALEALKFTQLIDALKSKKLLTAVRIIIANPFIISHLWPALRLRMRRFHKLLVH